MWDWPVYEIASVYFSPFPSFFFSPHQSFVTIVSPDSHSTPNSPCIQSSPPSQAHRLHLPSYREVTRENVTSVGDELRERTNYASLCRISRREDAKLEGIEGP